MRKLEAISFEVLVVHDEEREKESEKSEAARRTYVKCFSTCSILFFSPKKY